MKEVKREIDFDNLPVYHAAYREHNGIRIYKCETCFSFEESLHPFKSLICKECSIRRQNENNDPINPSHYQTDKYQVIDIIEGFNLDYHLGNVIKYVLRAGKKGDKIEDLKKARWYLDRVINETK